jgi:hypothetical protein
MCANDSIKVFYGVIRCGGINSNGFSFEKCITGKAKISSVDCPISTGSDCDSAMESYRTDECDE